LSGLRINGIWQILEKVANQTREEGPDEFGENALREANF